MARERKLSFPNGASIDFGAPGQHEIMMTPATADRLRGTAGNELLDRWTRNYLEFECAAIYQMAVMDANDAAAAELERQHTERER